ncbi:MAG TPA: FAD-dependent oxidoreductase, partial [Stellaceae bacterium]
MDGQASRSKPKTAIIGGGVIGLSVGWRLAQAGCAVEIFERSEAGKGASWAAAGMLAAGVETEPGELALHGLCRASQDAWPRFAAELEAASGQRIELRREGTLMVALNRDDTAQLRYTYDFQRTHGIALDWLSGAQARQKEPYLHPNLAAAVYCAGDHQVENRKLVRALRTAFIAAGGKLR